MNFSLFEVDDGSPAKPAKARSGSHINKSTIEGEGISALSDRFDSGLSLVDVKNEYAWTLNDRSSRADVPAIFLVEYQITGGQIQNALNYWQKNLILQAGDVATAFGNAGIDSGTGASADTNPYEGLYRAKKTGFAYSFPYFSSQRRSQKGSWTSDDDIQDAITQTKGIITHGGLIDKSVTKATSYLALGTAVTKSLVPHMGAEKAEIWESMDKQSITVQFDLLNTVSVEQTIKNYELISLLSYQNTYFRHNILLSYPPVIYEYLIPGVRSCPVATMDVEIEDLGNKRRVDSTNQSLNKKIFPDAYRVTLTLHDKVAESRNVLRGFFDDDIVSAIDSTAPPTA